MKILYLILFVYGAIGFTWFWYLAAMHLKHNKDKLNWVVKFFGYPWFLVALIIDVLFNIIVATILFLELPRPQDKEWLFTARVSRHIKGTGWRQKEAIFWCKYLLDPFDPSGNHCG